MTGVHEMFEEKMGGVTSVDHESETAMVAIRAGTPERAGLVRFVRLRTRSEAEFEVMAGSDMGRIGVGVGLARRLIGWARAPEVLGSRKVAEITGPVIAATPECYCWSNASDSVSGINPDA